MNPIEFASKALLLYSLRKNERIDLSCLPDEEFDKVLAGLSATRMCREGNVFTGKYLKDATKAAPYLEILKNQINGKYWPLNALIAFIDGLKDGDVFRIVSEDAPTMNKQLALAKIKGLSEGEAEMKVHNNYLQRFGMLSAAYRHYAYGYDGLRTVIGEGDKKKRVCRFCGKRMPEVSFKDVAHAISEGLGNKKLICNEECDDCNHKLSKTESNLMHYLDVRRAMGGILTKTDGTVPSVDGKGFVIRGDENKAKLYIEKENIPREAETTKPFMIRLETEETVTHQGIFKALCKIVIDLLPAEVLPHFHETIGWINGSVMDEELPPYYASYDREQVQQPTVDIFLSNNPGQEPYCAAMVHILDVLFAFVLPEVDVDKAQYKTEGSVRPHLAKFMSAWGGAWKPEDTCEYTLANPWVDWLVRPDDPQIEIRPAADPIFTRFKKEESLRDEQSYPEFTPEGISLPVAKDIRFKRNSQEPISVAELHQVSVNYERMNCRLERKKSLAVMEFSFNFSDSSNRLSYFDYSFRVEIAFTDFDKYITIADYFCIDYHLRDYLYAVAMAAGDAELLKYTAGTDLEPVRLGKLLDKRTMRQLHYLLPVGDDRYLVVKDAQIHNL